MSWSLTARNNLACNFLSVTVGADSRIAQWVECHPVKMDVVSSNLTPRAILPKGKYGQGRKNCEGT